MPLICKDCPHLAIDKEIFDRPWCLAFGVDIFSLKQECIRDKEEV